MSPCPSPALATNRRAAKAYPLVDKEMQAVERMLLTADVTAWPALRDVYTRILTRGGKRLRPALALLCASLLRAPGEALPSSVIALGAAVEMLHTSTLVHDDVIDDSTLRRGAPTLNAAWSAGATVLAGNYMFAQAAHYSAQTGNVRVNRIFSDSLEILVAGEIQQMKSRHDFDTARAQYFQRIAYKTSSIFRIATESAGILQGFSDVRVRQLKRFGHHFGIAFQVVDDILDYTSDLTALGKPAGSDLRSGNCTLPFYLYLAQHPEADKVLEDLKEANSYRWRTPGIWADKVEAFVADVRRSSAIDDAYALARAHARKAQQCLRLFPASGYRQALHALSAFAFERLT